MATYSSNLAVVTGASSGIGRELARLAAKEGYDLVVVSDDGRIEDAAQELRALGVDVRAVEADLSTQDGVGRFCDAVEEAGRPIDLLFANAGQGLGHAFLDQEVADWRRVVDTNVTGTLLLLHRLGRRLRDQGFGRILITGSIAGFMPGSYQAVYNGTKAFIDSFAFALRNELQESGVSVTCLMPGATDTGFFAQAGMLDTKVGQGEKQDPAEVARTGFQALMRGDGDVVSGWKNKLQTALAAVTPSDMLAEQHRKMAAPGTARSN